jgi:hypothetical protein
MPAATPQPIRDAIADHILAGLLSYRDIGTRHGVSGAIKLASPILTRAKLGTAA